MSLVSAGLRAYSPGAAGPMGARAACLGPWPSLALRGTLPRPSVLDLESPLRRRRSFDRPTRDPNAPRVNHEIRVPRVLVISDRGEKLGEFMTRDAVELAQAQGLDLIEVAPNARPPVCRLGDYGKMKYEKKKRDKESKAKAHQVQVKEVKLRPKTDEHDLAVKVRNATKFLEAGNKVKITVRFRGREHAHRDIGRDQCMRIFEEVKEISRIESPPAMEGRQMSMMLGPVRDPAKT